MPSLHRLRNPVRSYPWGARTVLAELEGREPTGQPEAELWMGAHRSAPSIVVGEEEELPLHDFIARDPAACLGAEAAARFQGTLPFLFKVLAVDAPLSVQAHPDAAQARAGFARENAAGVPEDAEERCYRDPNAKPELVCALSRFEALVGFRAPAAVRGDLTGLETPGFAALRAALEASGESTALERGLVTLLGLRPDAVAAAVVELADRGGVLAELVTGLARRYPGDPCALAPLLLHHEVLPPGEALFLGPGELHAYLRGTAVELMGNSDNVLRAGLTRKHLAKAELRDTLRFESRKPQRLVADEEGRYPHCAEEFALRVLRLEPGRPCEVPARGAEILLCTEGAVKVVARRGAEVELERGAALFAAASAGGYRLEGRGRVYAAGTGAA